MSRFSSPLGRAAGTSLLLHAVALAGILLWLGVPRPAEPPPTPSIELRLVVDPGAGAPAASAPPQAPPPQAKPDATAPAPPAPPPILAPAQPDAEPLPPPPPPAPPEPPAPAAPAPPAPAPAPPKPAPKPPARLPEMNLGGGDSLSHVTASGPAVLPARADSRWHNREPTYPPAAARRGEAGTVTLLIHVGPDGGVTGIDIGESSGFVLLDRAAREAVSTWHFLPAVRDGAPVASDMPMRVVFQLN